MIKNKGNLKPAHTGYRYQDIATAYYLIEAVLGKCDSVTVDKKQVEDDRLDDLEVTVLGKVYRKQIKSSIDTLRSIKRHDFTGSQSTLRIDRLVLTHTRSSYDVEEYRLSATWQPPTASDDLTSVLEAVDVEPTFESTNVSCFKLNSELIWPSNSNPIWTVLDEFTKPTAEFSRNDFVDFCEKFVIELQLPVASTDLLAPGPLEASVIRTLQDSVGIGQYPNAGRQSEDVAALAISLANLARTQEATLLPKDIAKSLEIRTDFGRISQAFPVDRNHFYNRPAFRQTIKNGIATDGVHIVTAPPGAGKSWDLTCLGEDLENDYVVARHYCYLEPGDDLIERRVTTDVFFANIIAELLEAEPELNHSSSRLSADMQTLEITLASAAKIGKEIVVIVDGLDHISRVKSSSSTLNDDETDIVERLSTLTLPRGVKLIIGSQPGEHLKPILSRREKDVFTYNLPSWNDIEVKELAKIHGIDLALDLLGIKEREEVDEVLSIIAAKSDGNPLYVRYLCKGLISAVRNGISDTPQEWLRSSPSIDGDIAVYYGYLYKKILKQAQAIADLFSVIDFSVSEAELIEIVPSLMSSYVPQALIALSPVLTDVTGQGGLRIFHESFRRFMLDELERNNQSLNSVLSPIILWLEQQGFYQSSKSYRFLLPALRRAEKNDELYRLVSHSFVSESVSSGHPIDAIQANLAIAADVAGRQCNWAILVRCAELRRALSTCFDYGHSWRDFWATYAELFGNNSLAERLLFDGKPTLSYEDGLSACLLVDDSGGVAPWNEYLSLSNDMGESSYGEDFDANKFLTSEESINLAVIQGRMSQGFSWRILRRFYHYLKNNADDPRLCFIRNVSKRFSKNGLVKTMVSLANRFDGQSCHIINFALRLGIADEYAHCGDFKLAKKFAEEAFPYAIEPDLAVMCMPFGVRPDLNLIELDISETIDIGVDSAWPEAQNIETWMASMRFCAQSTVGEAVFKSEINRVQGVGWYRCWLRYVLELSIAEFNSQVKTPLDICSIFSILSEDVHPFVGSPRACDLYRIHGAIKSSLALGLSLIKTSDEWTNILKIIQHVSSSISTRIDQEDGGPLSVGTIIDLLLPYVTSEVAGQAVCEVIEEQIKFLNVQGTYYSTHATYSMQRALMEKKIGLQKTAIESWDEVGVYLTGYGWRKDITLFDVIETIPVLANVSQNLALEALDNIQPYIGAVLRHTDGRSTNHTPNSWFDVLLETSPANAMILLTSTIIEEEGIESWPTITALKSIAKYACKKGNPMLVDALWETLPFKVECEGEGINAAKERLEPIELISELNSKVASERIVRLSAEAANDAKSYNEDAVTEIKNVASTFNIFIDCNLDTSTRTQPERKFSQKSNVPKKFLFSITPLPFPTNPSFVDIIKGIRRVADLTASKKQDELHKVSLYLSYKLDELLNCNDHVSARRILHFYAREISIFTTDIHPLGELATYLENAKSYSLATVAYALAYTQSRGGGGWFSFGGKSHRNVLHKAISLDRSLAESTVAEEVSYRLRNTDYGAGISKGLIQRISEWGDHKTAASCWQEAFDVISRRLPLTSENTWFAKFDRKNLVDWDIDEGLILILLARLSEPRTSRKISALNAIMNAIINSPESVWRPLIWWLKRDTKITDLQLVLQLLLYCEEAPYKITSQIEELLSNYLHSQIWGASVLSFVLLKRAGISYSCKNKAQPTDINKYPSVTAKEVETIFDYDINGSLEWLSDIDNSLPERIWRQFSTLVNDEVNDEVNVHKAQERLKLSLGREGKGYPPVDVVFWQFELFYAVLNDQACSLDRMIEQDEEILFLEQVLPNIRLHLAIHNSRVPRPNWHKPNELTSGPSGLRIVKGDSRYESWLQVGCVEEEYVTKEHSFSRPTEVIKIFSGAAVAPGCDNYLSSYFPFLDGDESLWWCEGDVELHPRPLDIWTQLLGVVRHRDWLGSNLILTPPEELTFILNITPPEFGEKLVWKDENEEPILVCRHWWVKGQQFDVESPQLKGSDIIVRPDVIKRLEELFSNKIRLYTDISKKNISER